MKKKATPTLLFIRTFCRHIEQELAHAEMPEACPANPPHVSGFVGDSVADLESG
jgi:hypothetical protein